MQICNIMDLFTGLGCCCASRRAKQRRFFQNQSNEFLEWEDSQGYFLWKLQAAHWPSFSCREVHEQGNFNPH